MTEKAIDTKRKVYLRPVSLSDVNDRYIAWLNDAEVNQFMETRFRSQRKSDIEAYVNKMIMDPNAHFFAVVLCKEDRHIGNAKLAVSPHHHRGEISLWIGDKSLWGKGLATEIISQLKVFAFGKLGLRKLTAGCYANNMASAKAFLKAGFFQEAVFKDHHVCGDRVVDGIRLACFHP